MSSEHDTEYKTVRGLSRGLQILNALNRVDGGASPTKLAELTGLHRTTVRRLLETLQDEGYVRRSESDDSFRLSMKVRELSEGFRDEQWISALAAPLLAELLQEVVWPTDLCTLDVDAMVVRETTHRFSRLSFHRSMVGRRMPIPLTATGLAYLAFCPDAERERIVELLASRDDEEGRLARDRAGLDNLLRRTRHRGYGENYGSWNSEERIAAIAVPIRGEQRVYGCISLIYVAKAMTIEQAAKRYLPALQRFAATVEQGIHEREQAGPALTGN
ncbi:DNA-binding transcriptional activator MhpR [Azotobacter vinelandii CA]|uniref:Bacterial regulatory protein, IclR family n=2 Tax=Azotobacter vinelandii TaxID=354 RepID=C1DRI6_AZOVD|nr:DNA-binding transcriptional regulator [Azotobacter vinelandii]ACO77724.1 Bacterial regulatory protein, IclR family [Azotobacter vinelandii DJ]AGK12449.1 DNA-binding transcriptional activator MhpR [Azotobacter vinelandii CA]AGK18285.1 DNA-binding transcriptional activator MhpR [Azotobacter vinelandii CA6]SFY28807.1 transcriptional regulator, IclR family [Azotobacter vinelandii]GLK61246.1 transcriptional regulator [Azotobacter vinelandii]